MKILAALLFAASTAHAQSALPNLTPDHPSAPYYLISKNGGCIWWYVDKGKFTETDQLGFEFVAYCATPAEFSKIGGRLATIVNSADPLKSLQTLPNRITLSKIRCPGMGKCTPDDATLGPIVAEMNAARGF